MTTIATESQVGSAQTSLRWGVWLMNAGAVAFIGYAVVFFALNFSDRFLELGIGHGEVDVGRQEIEAFSPSLLQYIGHLHIATAGGIEVFAGRRRTHRLAELLFQPREAGTKSGPFARGAVVVFCSRGVNWLDNDQDCQARPNKPPGAQAAVPLGSAG